MSKHNRSQSPLWHRALEKYREELHGADDYSLIQEVHTLEELLSSFSSIQIATPNNYFGLVPLQRIAPRLKFVDDFSAVLALCFGADAALTAAVWGSIRLILSHASSAAETLQDVLDMLEELSLTLPRFQVYEKTLPLDRQLQQSLVDVYCEIICFYARAIYFLRCNPHLVLRKNGWEAFRNDFSRTILRIKRMSSTVESEASLLRMRKDQEHYKEVLELLDSMALSKAETPQRFQFNNIPFAVNPKFSCREKVLGTIGTALDPEIASSSLKSVALLGLGGVGKSQIAIQFAHNSLAKFDVILWVAAENSISIGQSMRNIADDLGLLNKGEESRDVATAMFTVKKWFNATDSSFLVVFDNADDLQALKTVWPHTSRGAALITTRSFVVASTLAAIQVDVEVLDDDDGGKMLLKSLQRTHNAVGDDEHARAISHEFGGLPLALAQIGSFLSQRKVSLKDFLPLYRRHSDKIDARKTVGSDYEHTLDTVWSVSFDKLGDTATSLLRLLAFFNPDSISEDILLQRPGSFDNDLDFLSDEMGVGDAVEELLSTSLINRADDSSLLSVHRLVQSAIRKRLSGEECARYVDTVVRLLKQGFPDHSTTDIGHQISYWTHCEICLPHVHHLVQLAESSGQQPGDRKQYASLLLRCSWYLYEREMYLMARRMVEQALGTFDEESGLEFASALDLKGLIDLDLARPMEALSVFKRAFGIRKTLLGSEDAFISYSLNNIALAQTELDDLESAFAAHQEAIRLRLKANSDRIGNSYSNMASLLLRMGRPDEAEEMLARCPSLKDFTDDTFISTGNPRFSGDMVLLSRIRLAQGRPSEALRLATKALEFRRQLLGNRLKTCDSLYDVSCLLFTKEHTPAAIQLLEELVSVSETFPEGDGQRARSLWKLSQIYADKGMVKEAEEYSMKAKKLRGALRPDLENADKEEESFSKLCLWMLW